MKHGERIEGIDPAGSDKHGPYYNEDDVTVAAARKINSDTNFFYRRAKVMSKDIDSAKELTDQAIVGLSNSMNKFFDIDKALSDSVKKTTGNIRDSSAKLAAGLKKVESLANFDRLERYVDLLERAEKAISSLADLERSGKLEKIAGAIR